MNWRKTKGKGAADPMPCDDIAELIRIEIDSKERLRNFELNKQSCGMAIGVELPSFNNLKGRSIADILEIEIDDFCRKIDDEIVRFLSLKHLLALKMTIGTFIGQDDGGPEARCRIMEINYDENGVVIEAEIKVGIVDDKIRLCDSCFPGCAMNKSRRAG
jgi:hypothetical protein